jgi:FAD/FMN-containing dehydrogenase
MTAIASSFATKFAGIAIAPDGEGYDKARAIWNGAAGVRPALIAHCRTADDIIAAVNLTPTGGLPVAVRGGGHSVADLSTCEGGVVTGLSLTRKVTVRPKRRAAGAEPGATWADYDATTAAHGLASTSGLISTSGVAGLTLGGGIGWLQRRYGLACDNLVAAETSRQTDARFASIERNPHLLWGLRGGGNFGIASRVEFSLHPVSTVIGGLMLRAASRNCRHRTRCIRGAR